MDATAVRRKLEARVTAAAKAAQRGLLLAGEHLKTESQQEVPNEEGTLENSARVVVLQNGLVVAVVYGTAYAVRQHEELQWRHKGGRKAKYLEDPMNREAPVMARLIQRSVQAELGR